MSADFIELGICATAKPDGVPPQHVPSEMFNTFSAIHNVVPDVRGRNISLMDESKMKDATITHCWIWAVVIDSAL
jgi:hypothetical protein